MSFLAKQEIQQPAAADVMSDLAAVFEELSVVAPRLFQGVGQDGETVEGSLHVNDVGQTSISACYLGLVIGGLSVLYQSHSATNRDRGVVSRFSSSSQQLSSPPNRRQEIDGKLLQAIKIEAAYSR